MLIASNTSVAYVAPDIQSNKTPNRVRDRNRLKNRNEGKKIKPEYDTVESFNISFYLKYTMHTSKARDQVNSIVEISCGGPCK